MLIWREDIHIPHLLEEGYISENLGFEFALSLYYRIDSDSILSYNNRLQRLMS